MMVGIHESDDGVTIDTSDVIYKIREDTVTGDWHVECPYDTESIEQMWFNDKDSAVQYTLLEIGVIKQAHWNMAPERC